MATWTELTPLSTTNLNDLETRIANADTSVTNGKTTVAAAITGMGQAAAGSDSFATLATKIQDISDDATAVVGDVLASKTFYRAGAKGTGTLTNKKSAEVTGMTSDKIASVWDQHLSINPSMECAVNTSTWMNLVVDNLSAANIKKDVKVGYAAGPNSNDYILGTYTPPTGSQTFTASGTFTVPAEVDHIDVFLVGGGGGGAHSTENPCGGGGGGFVRTLAGIPVIAGAGCTVSVGAGGIAPTTGTNAAGGTGGDSSITVNGVTYSATGGGGGGASASTGGRGGSAGSYGTTGSSGYAAGSDGGNSTGGTIVYGQFNTTREWGRTDGTLFAGGGGGACATTPAAAAGGGGGTGGTPSIAATAGTANTGGGGGGIPASHTGNPGNGGSGIVIIRW